MMASASKMEESSTTQTQQSEPEAEGKFTLRRIVRFVTLVLAILLLADGFVCATWSSFFEMPGWLVWQALPALFPIAFVAASVLGFRYTHPALGIVYAVSAAWLGLLSFAFFAAAGCWLVEGIVMLAGGWWPQKTIATVLFGAAFLAAAYGLINAAWLRVTRVTIELPHLPETWSGRTVALVTDVHLGHLSGPGFLRRIVSRLQSLQPDMVLISGDMFDGSTADLPSLVAGWAGYSAPRGIYYVTGNHDEFEERSIYLNAVAHTGICVLNNEKVEVEGLQIVGVHDSEAGNPTALRTILRRARLDSNRPSILLAHRPENLAVAEEEGVSLQLSGHTHGGQFWPWNLIVSRIYGRFAYGLSRLGRLTVFTSNGAGTWGPPLRVGTKSEIVLIRLKSRQA